MWDTLSINFKNYPWWIWIIGIILLVTLFAMESDDE